MNNNDNKKSFSPRNSRASTPAQLLASVLEQRYSHKAKANLKGKDEKPDPMTFPAMQKALGSMYSTLVDVVNDDTEEDILEDEEEKNEETASLKIENVRELNEQLLFMVDEMEQGEKEREENTKTEVANVKKIKADPYNRAVNLYSEPPEELQDIDISEDLQIETIESSSRRKQSRRFRNEA